MAATSDGASQRHAHSKSAADMTEREFWQQGPGAWKPEFPAKPEDETVKRATDSLDIALAEWRDAVKTAVDCSLNLSAARTELAKATNCKDRAYHKLRQLIDTDYRPRPPAGWRWMRSNDATLVVGLVSLDKVMQVTLVDGNLAVTHLDIGGDTGYVPVPVAVALIEYRRILDRLKHTEESST